MHAVVVADGTPPPTRSGLDAAWPGWADGVELVVAADGGARACAHLGLPIDLAIGDFDSLGPDGLADLVGRGVPIERHPTDKDETDTELAVRAAVARGASRLTILGAFGGPRLDHELANVALLGLPELAGRDARLLDPRAMVRLVTAPDAAGSPVRLGLPGPVGGLVSLLPAGGDATGVTTDGLRFALADEVLPSGPARGLSNVRAAADASLVLRAGRLLVVELPARLPS